MKTLVSQQNFYLGCRVCMVLINAEKTSVSFYETIPDNSSTKYSDAYHACTELEVNNTDGLPQKLCSDCAAKLTIAFQFKRDATESEKVLKGYSEVEKDENEMYENVKFEDESEFFEYETIEELDESSRDSKEVYEEVTVIDAGEGYGGNDAVSFLTGILKPGGKEATAGGAKKVQPRKAPVNDSSVDDATRKHCCNVCHKKFQKRSNLIDHLRLHANVKVYSCEYCEKSFVQAGNYKAHIRTHTKEKPYSCHYCNKAYSQSSSLKIHIRSHTQEKNYICEVCEKAFTNASDLGKHRLIHDPVKRYKCDECQRHFTQKIHLRKHLEKHHPEISIAFVAKDSDQVKKEPGFDEEEEFELIEEEAS